MNGERLQTYQYMAIIRADIDRLEDAMNHDYVSHVRDYIQYAKETLDMIAVHYEIGGIK